MCVELDESDISCDTHGCLLNGKLKTLSSIAAGATFLFSPFLLRGNKPALIGCLSECNLTKVEQHLIAIRMLLLSSIGREALNA